MTTICQSTTKANEGIWVLLAVCLAALTLPLCFSGGAIATPAIGRALGGSALSRQLVPRRRRPVGWAERSDTRQLRAATVMGFSSAQ